MADYDINHLREVASFDPSRLSGDQKNALIRANIEGRLEDRSQRDSTLDEWASGGVTESYGWEYDPDERLGPSAGGTTYMRRITAATRKDLSEMQRERMLKIVTHLWDRNPMAAKVIKRAINYVLGEGVKVVAQNESDEVRGKIQEVLDEFWHDPRNRMDDRLIGWCTSWRHYGELGLRATVNPIDGFVRLAYVSPENMLKVSTEKDDIEQIEAVNIRLRPGDTKGKRFEAIRYSEETGPDGKPIPRKPGQPKRRKGEVFFWAANTLPDMVRGRSDLLAIADVLDAYDQFIWNRMERQAMLLAFVWSVELKNADEEDIDRWWKKNGGLPKPGSVQVHNDRVKWDAISPSLGSGEASQESDMLVNYISTSQGMPGMWFGRNQDPNRANGENLTGPTLKDFTALQKEFSRVIRDIVEFVIDAACEANTLPKDLVARECFEIQFPDLSVNDLVQTSTTLQTLVPSLVAAIEGNLMDKETAQEVVALVLAGAGKEVDLDEMRKNIDEAAEAAKAEQIEEEERFYEKNPPPAALAAQGMEPGGKNPAGKAKGPPGSKGPSSPLTPPKAPAVASVGGAASGSRNGVAKIKKPKKKPDGSERR